MASVARQPFAPLDGARLQNLTSIKNRQNAIPNSPAAAKRKADLIDLADSENVDPQLSAKRSKAVKGANGLAKGSPLVKPTNYVIKTTSSKQLSASASPSPALSSTTTPRRTLQAKSPAARLNTSISRPSPLSAPAGRSPTRGKRAGILSSRRRSANPYSRVDQPPSFNLSGLGGGAPFSLDAALKGTIPNYAPRPSQSSASHSGSALAEPESASDMKASWFFDIHEDTAEQEMTNLLQHGTCVLDISSDEESALRARREGREDKENVPPADDVSQTPARSQARLRQQQGDMVVDKERVALGEMKAADFYSDGCDESSIVIVPGDDEEKAVAQPQAEESDPIIKEFTFAPELKTQSSVLASDVSLRAEPEPAQETESEKIADTLMAQSEESLSSKAAVLQPIEGSGETFELWESGSAKDEQETITTSEASS